MQFCRKIIVFTALAMLLSTLSMAQSRSTKNWFDYGGSHVNKWLQIAPAAMGPNALPVPDMDYAKVESSHSLTAGAHYHSMPGDHAINNYYNFRWNIAPSRATVSIWGIHSERFRMSNEVRDRRQIYYDDKGWTTSSGDLWVSTYIQILRDKDYLPDMAINYTMKTTTGSNVHARYTDTPLHYFYLALGHSVLFKQSFIDEIRVAALGGFYVWQINKVEMAQDEGPVAEFGLQIKAKHFSLFNELGGYSGYDAYEFIDKLYGTDIIDGLNDPLIYRVRLQWQNKHFGISGEYQKGLHDYEYNTFRLHFTYLFNINKN